MADNSHPRNKQATLFKRLTRLFSGPIVNYNKQQIKRLKSTSIKNYTFTTSTGKEFKKKEYYNLFEPLQSKQLSEQNREYRYADFDQMEYMPEIASAIDIYADEMTTSNSFEPLLNIKCTNLEIKTILHYLF